LPQYGPPLAHGSLRAGEEEYDSSSRIEDSPPNGGPRAAVLICAAIGRNRFALSQLQAVTPERM
jgi:hypothetical protein